MKRFALTMLALVLAWPACAAPLEVPVYFVRTADDNGENEAAANIVTLANLVVEANLTWESKGIKFLWKNEATNVHPSVVKSTLLNRDFAIAAGEQVSNKDYKPKVSDKPFSLARNAFAQQHMGKIVVFLSRGSELKWNARVGKWVEASRTGWGWSNHLDSFIAFPAMPNLGGGNFFAHEVGHYLHLGHTHSWEPANVQEFKDLATKAVNEWGKSPYAIPNMFDGDSPLVSDTPYDPGPNLFAAVTGKNACDTSVNSFSIDMTFNSVKHTYTFTPDRTNIMSYFKDCAGTKTISSGQTKIVNQALQWGNRQHLVPGVTPSWTLDSPAALVLPDDKLVLSARGVRASLHYKYLNGDGTTLPADSAAPWENFDLNSLSSPVIARGENDGFSIFYRGHDKKIWQKTRKKNGWVPSDLDAAYTVEDALALSQPAVGSSDEKGRHDLVFVKTDGSVKYHLMANWTRLASHDLGGQVVGDPAIAYDPAVEASHIFARFADGSIRHKVVFRKGGLFPRDGSWENLGGLAASNPVAVSWGPHRVDLVVRGADNAIWIKSFANGLWTNWNSLGGIATDNPAVVSYGEGNLDIVVRGANGSIYHKMFNKTSWWPAGAEWEDLGGYGVGSPVVVSRGFRSLLIFVRGLDGGVYQKSYVGNHWEPSAQDWKDLGRNL